MWLIIGSLNWLNINTTQVGHVAWNDIDIRVETCCEGSNLNLMGLSGQVWKVTPFLDLYDMVIKIPLVCYKAVSASKTT